VLSVHGRAWLESLERRDYSRRTIDNYKWRVRAWCDWLDPRTELDATPDDVEKFLDDRGVEGRTRYHWLAMMHSFYTWAIRYNLTSDDPTLSVDRPKLHGYLPRPIADEDLSLALEMACPQMRAWLLCGALAGMRCAEIAGLKRADVVESRERLRILGKGRKERVVPLHPQLLEAIRRAGLPRSGPVFTRPLGGPYTPQAVSRAVSRYLHDLGIDATAHQLRHWFATQTYATSGDLLVVQNLLGHSSPTTTAVYTAWSRPAAEAAVGGLALPA
jgi:site-specific recombinase XerD